MLTQLFDQTIISETTSAWNQEISTLMENLYQSKLNKLKLGLKVWGIKYTKENILAVSVMEINEDSKKAAIHPKTFATALISSTEVEAQELIDPSSVILDFLLSQKSLADGSDDLFCGWTDFQYNSKSYFYSISRIDVELTLKADQLLSSH
jgi:hypothetical protein